MPASEQFFAPDSLWNEPVPADAAIDPDSATLVNSLVAEEATQTVSVQTTPFGVPIYTVGPNQPTVAVQTPNALLNQAMTAVPMPTNATPAPGSDGNLAVYQPSSDTMWEFWRLVKGSTGWSASWGGRMVNVSTSPGYYQNIDSPSGAVIERANWGAPATSFPVVGGVMTISELESGQIDHALAMSIQSPKAGEWVAPAQRSDGKSTAANAIPEGAHFRLDPNLNLASLNLPPFVYMIAVAAQKYGIVITNGTVGMAFRAEDPTQFEQANGYNPYFGPDGKPGTPGALYNEWPDQMLKLFPWSHLELLKMDIQTQPSTSVITQP